MDITTLVSLTEDEAVQKIKDAGMKCRLRSKNGNNFIVTMDYRLDRVNLWIDAGIVTKVSLG